MAGATQAIQKGRKAIVFDEDFSVYVVVADTSFKSPETPTPYVNYWSAGKTGLRRSLCGCIKEVSRIPGMYRPL